MSSLPLRKSVDTSSTVSSMVSSLLELALFWRTILDVAFIGVFKILCTDGSLCVDSGSS